MDYDDYIEETKESSNPFEALEDVVEISDDILD
jgi:hypothetical protein